MDLRSRHSIANLVRHSWLTCPTDQIEDEERALRIEIDAEGTEAGEFAGFEDTHKRELLRANEVMKSTVHGKLTELENEKYTMQDRYNKASREMEEQHENMNIYNDIIKERKRALTSNYLTKN